MVKNTKKNRIVKTSVSVVIIYGGNFNEISLEAAKKSVKWCDEIILINGNKGSFSDWRNEGLEKAKGDWILYLDTDEELSKDLKIEICKLIENWKLGIGNSIYAYAIPRKNFIFGNEFTHSGQYPDYQKRLFKKEALKKWIGKVHEEPIFDGELGHLLSPLIHHKNMTIAEMIEKTNKWSEIEADLMIKANHPPMNIFRFMSAGFREFVLRFIKQKAYLDGKEGIIYGIYQIYSKLISYSKLWEKQLKNKL